MTPYHQALYTCGRRYRDMLVNRDSRTYQTIWNFVNKFIEECEKGMPVPKLCRWLGWIQRDLVEHGLTTQQAEQEWTRPLFRPLDYPEGA